MKRITIDTENAAFDPPESEVARILRKLADKAEGGEFDAPIMDLNGNRVGDMAAHEEMKP